MIGVLGSESAPSEISRRPEIKKSLKKKKKA
jgi:hypothetical protein